MDLPDLRSYYLDLAVLDSAAVVYRLINEALRSPGDSVAALEVALLALDAPLLVCLDNAHTAIAAGWGETLLESLARMVRGSALMLVVVVEGAPPLLSERFATIRLGALAQSEIRLLTEVYLQDTGVTFTPPELRELSTLSAAHPAYLQRAAFYLFENKQNPSFDWRAAYLAEVRAHPIPGAPLPPAVFEGTPSQSFPQSSGGGDDAPLTLPAPQQRLLPETPRVLFFLIILLIGLLAGLMTQNILTSLVVLLIGGAVAYALLRMRAS